MAKGYVRDLSGMGRPVSLRDALVTVWRRAKGAVSPRCPYRVGDTVIGDDPFSGRREGVVVWHDRRSVGLKTTHGVFFYDHRVVKPMD
ncbi:hypothetical protein [Pseudarthrobacter sp. lyk4-40-TYG-27]|uniref:hypothetical protein n=1 Tax=Pseudarthrobacter sp. lyk4-40-TYG-27 TaxID=3040305 RepID=UPI002553F0EE|nr:hypothetical protein [Pseudarthrobacter sp. lyk4-40-TYG-27]